MVDPIEVKLDEINDKIDQIAYSPKYKSTYEIDEMIKKRSSGGAGGVGAGGILGGVAAGTLLADAIKNLTKQSKILSNVQQKIGDALGLLIDLVLLPFLPILAGGIIALYNAIVIAGGLWQKLVDILGLPLSLIVLGTGAILALLAGAVIIGTVSLVISAASAALYALLVGAFTPIITASVVFLSALAGTFSGWFYGAFGISLSGLILPITVGIIVGLAVVKLMEILGIMGAITELGEGWRTKSNTWFTAAIDNANILANVLNGIADVMNVVLGTNILTKNKASELIAAGIYNSDVMERLRIKYGEQASYGFGAYWEGAVGGKKLQEFATGGTVQSTGLAYVHQGETITPAGQGGHTFNFYGYQDDQFIQKIRDVLRQDGTRHNQ